MQLRDLQGKRVLLWGAAREAAAFVGVVERRGLPLEVTVGDEHPHPGATVGGHPVVQLTDEVIDAADVIVRSPGVSRYRPEIQRALERGAIVTSATNLWFAEPHAPVIAVTGTKGKSTTASLIAALLEGVGLVATLAGNIGRSPLEVIDEPQPDWWVLELSSYQTSDLRFSPDIAVLTNLSPEHLDWHGHYDVYVSDKLNLFAHGPKVAIVDAWIAEPDRERVFELSRVDRLRQAGDPSGVCVDDGNVIIGGDVLFSREVLPLRGRHNERLLCLALTAVESAGVDLRQCADQLVAALQSFEPLPHRLDVIAEHDSTLYVNDSLSTTPVASIAALEAFADRSVTILMGGYDRGLEYEELAAYVAGRDDVRVVTLPDNGSRIAAALRSALEAMPDSSDAVVADRVLEAGELEEAIDIAIAHTPIGGAVLLSPGAPSFGRFQDYAERGNAFAQYVTKRIGCN